MLRSSTSRGSTTPAPLALAALELELLEDDELEALEELELLDAPLP